MTLFFALSRKNRYDVFRLVGDMLRAVLDEFFARAESPTDAYRVRAGIVRRLHVDARIANHPAVLGRRAALRHYLSEQCRIGLQRHSVAVAVYRREPDVGEKLVHQFACAVH